MTSTNDEKDVKSNQTSGHKGKSYYIELYKSLDGRLSGEGDVRERTQHLCEAWRRVHSLCVHSAPSTHTHLLSWLQRHTARTILQTEWQSPSSKDEQARLDEAIDSFVEECRTACRGRDGHSPPWEFQLLQRAEWFKTVLTNPWGHPVLRVLLDPYGKPNDTEVLEWLKEERGVMFVTRLRQLASSKCDDLANTLATAVMDRVRAARPAVADAEPLRNTKENAPKPVSRGPSFEEVLKAEAGFTVDVWELLTDIEFVLLHKQKQHSKCIELAKQTPLRNGYQLVERLLSRLETSAREKKLWKNAKDVATLIAQVIIARCMVVPVCMGVSRTALYCCTRSLARMLAPARLPAAFAALAAPAATARHLHTLATAVHAQSTDDMKPFVCELYVRAITSGMNELERLKLKAEKDLEARSTEQTLASWFIQLGALLAGSARIQCECTLTAFSVHPTPAMYDRIKAAPVLPPIAMDVLEPKHETTSEFGSWASDSRSQTNFVKTSETLNLKQQTQANVLSTALLTEGEGNGLSAELCQDIAVLLSGPRVKTLSWDMDRDLLLENCRTYMERTHCGTRALTTELKYLNLDPNEYQHLPEEEDDESDLNYGIEKGYELLVEEQVLEPQPEEIWQDAIWDPEHTESASSSITVSDDDKPRRKKKNKKSKSCEEDSDPLSLVAETKRTEKKKERPHSKERSKEPKKKAKSHTGDSSQKEHGRDRRKETSKSKKKKEKQERKKKQKEGEDHPGILSQLIGIKVVKMPLTPDIDVINKNKRLGEDKDEKVSCVSDNDNASQGRSSLVFLNTEENDLNILYDGQFSMDEIKSSERTLFSENSRHTKLSSNELNILNRGVPINIANQAPHKQVIVKSELQSVKFDQKPVSVSNAGSVIGEIKSPNSDLNTSKSLLKEEVNKNIRKLILFRRPKQSAVRSPSYSPNIVRPATPQQESMNLKMEMAALVGSKIVKASNSDIPKVHINKNQTEQLSLIKNELNDSPTRTSQPGIQQTYKNNNVSNNKDPTATCSRVQPINLSYTKKSKSKLQSSVLVQNIPSNHTVVENVNPFIQQTHSSTPQNVQPHSSTAQKMQPHSNPVHSMPHQEVFKEFVKELHGYANAGSVTLPMEDRASLKKEVKPMSRVTPVMPIIKTKAEISSPLCAKPTVPLKKADSAPNTFSRLNYMHKNKQGETKSKPTSEQNITNQIMLQNSISAELDKRIADIRLNKVKYLRSKGELIISRIDKSGKTLKPTKSPRVEVQSIEAISKSSLSSLIPDLPVLSNMLKVSPSCLLKTVTKNEYQTKNDVPEPSRVVSEPSRPPPALAKATTLSEKDQQDLLLLLRQQSKLNAPLARPHLPSNNIVNNLHLHNTPKVFNVVASNKCASVPFANETPLNKTIQSQFNQTQYEGDNIKIPLHNDATAIKTADLIQNKFDKTSSEPKKSTAKLKSKIVYSESVIQKTVLHSNQGAIKPANCNKEEAANANDVGNSINAEQQDWASVLDAIRAHKTPSRGPNALDMVLKKDSHQKLSGDSLRNQRIIKKTDKMSEVIADIKQHGIVTIPKSTLSAVNTAIVAPSKPMIAKTLTDVPKRHNHNATIKKSNQIDVLKRRTPDSTKKNSSGMVKECDPFISGIPNSDYDLINELMDDDLRQEIGELSSDDENYVPPQVSAPKETNVGFNVKSRSDVLNKPINAVLNKDEDQNFFPHCVFNTQKDICETDKSIMQKTIIKRKHPAKTVAMTPIIPTASDLTIVSNSKNNLIANNEIIKQKMLDNASIACINSYGTLNKIVLPASSENKLTYNVSNKNDLNRQFPQLIGAAPQSPARNVVVFGADLVYDTARTQQINVNSRLCHVNQSTCTGVNNAPNVSFQTPYCGVPPHHTTSVGNQLVIGNNTTVAISHNNFPAVMHTLPVLTDPGVSSHKRDVKNVLKNKTQIITQQSDSTLNHKSDVNKVSGTKCDAFHQLDTDVHPKVENNLTDFNLKNCDRKVLSEVQEKLLTSDKVDLKNSRKLSFDSDSKKDDVLKDQERLMKKRHEIVNREINLRCNNPPIALTYTPLINSQVAIHLNEEFQQNRSNNCNNLNLDMNSVKSQNLSETNKLIESNSENMTTDTIEDYSAEKNCSENTKENKQTESSCRRILLRSSNNLTVKAAIPVNRNETIEKNIKIRHKNISSEPIIAGDENEKKNIIGIIKAISEKDSQPLEKLEHIKAPNKKSNLVKGGSIVPTRISKRILTRKNKTSKTNTKTSPLKQGIGPKHPGTNFKKMKSKESVNIELNAKDKTTLDIFDIGLFDLEEAIVGSKIDKNMSFQDTVLQRNPEVIALPETTCLEKVRAKSLDNIKPSKHVLETINDVKCDEHDNQILSSHEKSLERRDVMVDEKKQDKECQTDKIDVTCEMIENNIIKEIANEVQNDNVDTSVVNMLEKSCLKDNAAKTEACLQSNLEQEMDAAEVQNTHSNTDAESLSETCSKEILSKTNDNVSDLVHEMEVADVQSTHVNSDVISSSREDCLKEIATKTEDKLSSFLLENIAAIKNKDKISNLSTGMEAAEEQNTHVNTDVVSSPEKSSLKEMPAFKTQDKFSNLVKEMEAALLMISESTVGHIFTNRLSENKQSLNEKILIDTKLFNEIKVVENNLEKTNNNVESVMVSDSKVSKFDASDKINKNNQENHSEELFEKTDLPLVLGLTSAENKQKVSHKMAKRKQVPTADLSKTGIVIDGTINDSQSSSPNFFCKNADKCSKKDVQNKKYHDFDPVILVQSNSDCTINKQPFKTIKNTENKVTTEKPMQMDKHCHTMDNLDIPQSYKDSVKIEEEPYQDQHKRLFRITLPNGKTLKATVSGALRGSYDFLWAHPELKKILLGGMNDTRCTVNIQVSHPDSKKTENLIKNISIQTKMPPASVETVNLISDDEEDDNFQSFNTDSGCYKVQSLDKDTHAKHQKKLSQKCFVKLKKCLSEQHSIKEVVNKSTLQARSSASQTFNTLEVNEHIKSLHDDILMLGSTKGEEIERDMVKSTLGNSQNIAEVIDIDDSSNDSVKFCEKESNFPAKQQPLTDLTELKHLLLKDLGVEDDTVSSSVMENSGDKSRQKTRSKSQVSYDNTNQSKITSNEKSDKSCVTENKKCIDLAIKYSDIITQNCFIELVRCDNMVKNVVQSKRQCSEDTLTLAIDDNEDTAHEDVSQPGMLRCGSFSILNDLVGLDDEIIELTSAGDECERSSPVIDIFETIASLSEITVSGKNSPVIEVFELISSLQGGYKKEVIEEQKNLEMAVNATRYIECASDWFETKRSLHSQSLLNIRDDYYTVREVSVSESIVFGLISSLQDGYKTDEVIEEQKLLDMAVNATRYIRCDSDWFETKRSLHLQCLLNISEDYYTVREASVSDSIIDNETNNAFNECESKDISSLSTLNLSTDKVPSLIKIMSSYFEQNPVVKYLRPIRDMTRVCLRKPAQPTLKRKIFDIYTNDNNKVTKLVSDCKMAGDFDKTKKSNKESSVGGIIEFDFLNKIQKDDGSTIPTQISLNDVNEYKLQLTRLGRDLQMSQKNDVPIFFTDIKNTAFSLKNRIEDNDVNNAPKLKQQNTNDKDGDDREIMKRSNTINNDPLKETVSLQQKTQIMDCKKSYSEGITDIKEAEKFIQQHEIIGYSVQSEVTTVNDKYNGNTENGDNRMGNEIQIQNKITDCKDHSSNKTITQTRDNLNISNDANNIASEIKIKNSKDACHNKNEEHSMTWESHQSNTEFCKNDLHHDIKDKSNLNKICTKVNTIKRDKVCNVKVIAKSEKNEVFGDICDANECIFNIGINDQPTANADEINPNKNLHLTNSINATLTKFKKRDEPIVEFVDDKITNMAQDLNNRSIIVSDTNNVDLVEPNALSIENSDKLENFNENFDHESVIGNNNDCNMSSEAHTEAELMKDNPKNTIIIDNYGDDSTVTGSENETIFRESIENKDYKDLSIRSPATYIQREIIIKDTQNTLENKMVEGNKYIGKTEIMVDEVSSSEFVQPYFKKDNIQPEIKSVETSQEVFKSEVNTRTSQDKSILECDFKKTINSNSGVLTKLKLETGTITETVLSDYSFEIMKETDATAKMDTQKDDCSENISDKKMTLIYTNDSVVTLNGIEYNDPVIGTCYVFPITGNSDCSDNSDVLNDSTESISPVINEIDDDDSFDLYDDNEIKVTVPKVKYFKRCLKRKIIIKEENVSATKIRRGLKGKIEPNDCGVIRYRRGKHIDSRQLKAAAANSTYMKEYERLVNYSSSIKFSYSIPFHTLYGNIDGSSLVKDWPIEGNFKNNSESEIVECESLFQDIEKIEIFDPMKQTLADEIAASYSDFDYPSSDINEDNFNMGFGERSDRVIQNFEDGGVISKFSAATLSDVKQSQPFLLSEDYDICESKPITPESTKKDQEDKNKSYINYIQLRDKVRSFFRKTREELTLEWLNENKSGKNYSNGNINISTFPFDLYISNCIKPFRIDPVVQVVQVGQLPVSAAAQNPVTCDPRVTQVSDASPSQCSAENSLHDSEDIKTEYTELTTADLTLPLVQTYSHHNSMESQGPINASITDENIPIQTEVAKPEDNASVTSEYMPIQPEMIKTEDTDEYVPTQSELINSEANSPTTDEYALMQPDMIKSEIKIELEEIPEVKERPELKETCKSMKEQNSLHDKTEESHALANDHSKTINAEYSYETNNATAPLETDSNVQLLYSPSEKQHKSESYMQQKEQNGTPEKIDQIAHAMNAAGITTSAETITNTRAHALVNILAQKLRHGADSTSQTSTNNYPKTTITAMALQQALAQILPPPLNQTNATENNQQPNSQVTPQVLHIVQGKNSSGSQITLVDNSQQSVINNPNISPVLHIVQNNSGTTGSTSNGTPAPQSNAFGGLSFVDTGIQGGNQLLHIVNTGNQKNNNAGQLLKRVNLLTNLANVQGSNEQKMVQFVCKSADGKSIQLNGPHQRSMVLRLQPIESPSIQNTTPKTVENQDQNPTSSAVNTVPNKESLAAQQEIKSRSIYEENYAKFIQHSKPNVAEKSTSLPKFNQAFGKPVFQDGTQQKQSELNNENSHLASVNTNTDNSECQPSENSMNLEHINQIGSPPLLLRKQAAPTSQPQPNLVQQLKQTIAPMNIQTMHGGVIYTRQIPVNIGGGQTINLITVPSTELIDDSVQKQQSDVKYLNQHEMEPSIIKIVPQSQPPNAEVSPEDNNHMGAANDNTQNLQPQPVLTQMRIKLPMLSKTPQMVSGARVVRPSFFHIQRNVIGGANQPVYQQLVLTAAPPLGQQTVRLPQAQASRQTKVPVESQSSPESQMSSSTLEQLREFDMVLEQVKERSTVQPNGSSNNNFKPHTSTTDTTDSNASASSTPTETTQQILYSIGSNQQLNVAYVNRKSTVTPTTSTYAPSPDSSGIADSPTSSTHGQIPHTVTGESSSSDNSAQQKPAKVGSKSKSRPKSSSHHSSAVRVHTVPPKTSTQKPLEDEQTTQRILYILAEYKEQVENSPDKDKPAPRRRSNPPSNPPGTSKRKKSSSGSRRSGTQDHSPVHGEDTCRTMGSEDSSCGTSQGDCNENCLETNSPQDSPRKIVRKLTFDQEPALTQARPQPQRNVIVADGQTITVARGTAGKPATAVLMPANYILPVSMVKGGQQIAIVTNRGPKLLTVGGEGGATNALLLQRLIGPAGLKPVLARPGVRHVRLPAAALHNLQAFNLTTATTVQPPDSTASPAPAPTPPELVETQSQRSPWADQDLDNVNEEESSPEQPEPWNNLPSSADPHDYIYEEIVQTDNLDRTVLGPIPGRYSPDMEAQRIFDKMFDVESKKSFGDSPRCGYDIDASDCDDKPYHQVVQKKDASSHRQHRLTHVSAAALRHKYAILEHELRLQKSLSEECEDLGVDSPSASELFPEAELLFAASPAHEHAHEMPHSQDIHTAHHAQPAVVNQSGVRPDIDDQIATDQLLAPDSAPAPRQGLDVNLGLEDVGIVTVSEDGMQATIALDHEEFARSHPNTTFHSEPTEGEVQPFTVTGLKGRHITSTIFHSNRGPATVLMTAPQATVISQASAETSNATNTVKYSDIDNMINSLPTAQGNNINLSSVLVKDDGLTRFDNILNDSRELHLSNTASAIVHPAGNATQVIRRVCYDEDKGDRDTRFLMDEPEAIIAGDDAKMTADDSRDAPYQSIANDVDDDNSSPERHAELFWESNSASERSESRRPMDYSSDSDKCCKSPSYDETNSTDSSGVGTHMRLDSVIKEARGADRSCSADGSSADDTHPPLRTYPPKRLFHPVEGEMERSLSGKTRAGERSPYSLEVRRRASVRGVVKRGCHCCNGSPAPPRAKKPRQRKPTIDFTANN